MLLGNKWQRLDLELGNMALVLPLTSFALSSVIEVGALADPLCPLVG